MPELKEFKIVIDNPNGVVLNGQTLSGKLIVDLDKPIEVRCVILEATGFAETSVPVRHHHHAGDSLSDRRTHHVFEEINYFNIQMKLFGQGEKQTMASGRYEFPFSFVIPANAPSSFEGTNGFIRYYCKVVIDRPWAFDFSTKSAFTVICVTDLNYMPNLRDPANLQTMKTVGGCCKTSGDVEASLSVLSTGFVPGQSIFVNALIDNRSSETLAGSKIAIKQIVTFRARGAEIATVFDVAKAEKGQILPGKIDEYKDLNIPLPATAPSSLLRCPIIEISYYIKLKVLLGRLSSGLNIQIPIVIGTVPLSALPPSTTVEMGPLKTSDSITPPTLGQLPPEGSSENYLDIPPPSYEACVLPDRILKEDKDLKANDGSRFVPVYPTYR